MTMWIIILWSVMAYWAASMLYLGIRLPDLFNLDIIAGLSKAHRALFGLVVTVGVMGIITLCIDFINAIVCVVYVAMIWALSDFLFWLIEKFFNISFAQYYAVWMAVVLSVIALVTGWHLAHHVWETKYKPYRKITRTCNDKCKKCKDWKMCGGDAFHTYDFDENRPLICARELFKDDYELREKLQKKKKTTTKTKTTKKSSKKKS